MSNIPYEFFEKIRVRFDSSDESIDDLIIDDFNNGQLQINSDNQRFMFIEKNHEQENNGNGNNISNKEDSLEINTKIRIVSKNNMN